MELLDATPLDAFAYTASLWACLAAATATAVLGFWRLIAISRPSLSFSLPQIEEKPVAHEPQGRREAQIKEIEGERELSTPHPQKVPFFEFYDSSSPQDWEDETPRRREREDDAVEMSEEEEEEDVVSRWRETAPPLPPLWSGEVRWYWCQDWGVINGNVVRLWSAGEG